MLGFIESRHAEGTRGWQLLDPAQQQAIHDHTLLQRSGRLDEVNAAVLFLIRDATFMTGARLVLDGGYSLGHSRIPTMPPGVHDLDVQEAE